MIYRVILHAPAPDDEDAALERVRAALERSGIQPDELRVEDWHEGGRAFHIEAGVEAPSSYHATQVSAPELFQSPLIEAEIGIEGERIDFVAQRYDDDRPAHRHEA